MSFPGCTITSTEDSLQVVCIRKGRTGALVRLPAVGEGGCLGDLRESAVRELEALLQALRAGGNFIGGDDEKIYSESSLLMDNVPLKKLNDLRDKGDGVPILSVLPPNETVELYEKFYPLRGINTDKNLFDQNVTPRQARRNVKGTHKGSLLGRQRNSSGSLKENEEGRGGEGGEGIVKRRDEIERLWNGPLGNYFPYSQKHLLSNLNGIHSDAHRETLSLFSYDRLLMRRKMTNTIFAAEITAAKQSDLLPSHFLIRFHVSNYALVKTVSCHIDEHISDVVSRVIALLNRGQNSVFQNFEAEDYIVKLCGRNEFVLHDAKLSSITRLRECLEQAEEIKLVLVETRMISLYGLREALSKERTMVHSNKTFSICQRALDVSGTGHNQGLFIPLEAIEGTLNFSLRSMKINTDLFKEKIAIREFLQVQCTLYYGSAPISEPATSAPIPSSQPEWEDQEMLSFEEPLSSLPLETRLSFVVYSSHTSKFGGEDKVVLGWVNLSLFDQSRNFVGGGQEMGLWLTPDVESSGISSSDPRSGVTLLVDFPEYPLPLKHQFSEEFIHGAETVPSKRNLPPPKVQKEIERVFAETDSLTSLTVLKKELIWEYREAFMGNPEALPIVLQSVDWLDKEESTEVGTLLRHWAKPSPEIALRLLNFLDFRVQEYALRILEELSESTLLVYLFFFIHAIKMSCFHDTALTRFLLTRALQRPHHIGHHLFWNVVSEMQDRKSSLRYGLMMDAFLRGCGASQRTSFLDQLSVCGQLERVAKLVQSAPPARRKQLLQQELVDLDIPANFQNPVNPMIEVSSLRIEKCKVMESFTAPIWLTFSNADPTAEDPVRLLFKVGDDLRQDSLVVYALRVIDLLWKKHGLDLRLSLYECLPTGDCAGFIEVVTKSDALANIQKSHAGGGFKGAMSAFSKSPLSAWLRANADGMSLPRVVENFMFSCAGYTVASFVLGLGDRHNDNIMIRKSGHLFHIDFAHFLGNMMKWRGIKRETAPFVLTNEFVHVMGGEKSEMFKSFVSLCCTAYNVLRKHTNLLVSLFVMMLHAGLPQLRKAEDIEHLKVALAVGMTDVEADVYFRKLIIQSLKSRATKMNFAIHNLAKMGREAVDG